METTTTKNIATFTHLSTLSQYFIPFGNFILPLVIWSSTKKDSSFADSHGKEAINFQLSIFLYTVILCLISIPTLLYTIFSNVPFEAVMHDEDFFIKNLSVGNISTIVAVAIVALLILVFLKVVEFFLVIFASVRAANGEDYHYPMAIRFIK